MHQPPGSGLGGQGEGVELVVGDVQDPLGGVEHAGAVESAGQRQEDAGGVGEAGDQPGGVATRGGRHGCDDPRGAQGHARLPGTQPQAESGTGVVAAAGAENEMAQVAPIDVAPAAGGGLVRADDARQDDALRILLVDPQGEREQVAAVGVGHGVEVAGARRIGAVSDQRLQGLRPRQPPRQPVVREADGGDAARIVGLMIRQPAQLGDRQRGDRDAADGVGPGLPSGRLVSIAQLADEIAGGLGRTGVVPQQGGSDDLAVGVEDDHAVLLPAHGQGGDVVEAAGVVDRLPQRPPPMIGVDLGAIGMRRLGLADEGAGDGVADDDLAGLRRGVDAGDECHAASFHGEGDERVRSGDRIYRR